MIIYLLVFLAGGFIGILLMSLLFLGRKEDDMFPELYKNIKTPLDTDLQYSLDSVVAESDEALLQQR